MKIVLLVSMLLCIANAPFCQDDTASLGRKPAKEIKAKLQENDSISAARPSRGTIKADPVVSADDAIVKASSAIVSCPCNDQGEVHGFFNWLLIFTPVILFVIFILILFLGKGLSDFEFKGALAENEIAKHTLINPEYIRKQDGSGGIIGLASLTPPPSNLGEILPPTIDVTIIPPGTEAKDNYRPSISRFVAFFSGMLTVIIAVCMASFFVFHYIRTSCPPDLSALSIVLVALGLGVTPYAINKLSGAVASRRTDE